MDLEDRKRYLEDREKYLMCSGRKMDLGDREKYLMCSCRNLYVEMDLEENTRANTGIYWAYTLES